jgi:hypothetical protein
LFGQDAKKAAKYRIDLVACRYSWNGLIEQSHGEGPQINNKTESGAGHVNHRNTNSSRRSFCLFSLPALATAVVDLHWDRSTSRRRTPHVRRVKNGTPPVFSRSWNEPLAGLGGACQRAPALDRLQ